MKLEVGADAPLRRAQVEQALKLTEKWNLGIFDGSGTISLQDEFLYNKIVRWRESNETK